MKNISMLRKMKLFDYILIFILSLYALIVIYPFYNSILVSFVSQSDYIMTPFMLFPKKIIFDSYIYVYKTGMLFSSMKITAVITIVGVIYNMLLTLLCAYVLSKPFPGRKFVAYLIVFTVYFTGGLIPNYLLIKDLHLVDNIFAMILPTGITFMYMTVLRKSFESIPKSLEESAKIDGANDITILFRIVLPLSLPIIATFTLYYGVERWNEWWNGMLYIKSSRLQPLQLVLRNIIQEASTVSNGSGSSAMTQPFGDGIKMASTIISMLPIMMVYPFLQKFFISGLVVGAVKE